MPAYTKTWQHTIKITRI